jgi:FAD/FMN-containing dehydrogenase
MLTSGRSSGGNSLSIRTHNIRGIETMKGDKRALAHGAPAAVKISAGMRMFELYTEMAKQKLTVMGGADLNVGIMGWTTGAGHGPLTSIYGMGADQVLEMEVVTPDGEYRVVNEKTFPNLFWAIRGV